MDGTASATASAGAATWRHQHNAKTRTCLWAIYYVTGSTGPRIIRATQSPRIDKRQRIVEHVAVAVEALAVVGLCHRRVGAQPSPDRGIVHSRPGEDEPRGPEHLVAGVAERGKRLLGAGVGVGGDAGLRINQLAPGAPGKARLHLAIALQDGRKTPLRIVDPVVGAGDTGGIGLHHGDDRPIGDNALAVGIAHLDEESAEVAAGGARD